MSELQNAEQATPANEAAAPETSQVVTESKASPATDTIDSDLAAVWEKHNPKRGADGKFASNADPEEGSDPGPDDSSENDNSADEPSTETQAEPAQPAIEPPVSWSAEMKAKWATLPPDVQGYLATRDKDSHTAITRLGQQVKAAEPLLQVTEQYKDAFRRNNLAPHDGIARLLQFEGWLSNNPTTAIGALIQQYANRLDFAKLGFTPSQPTSGTESPSTTSPELLALRQELAQVKGYLTEQQRQQHEAVQAKEQEASAALERQLADFAKDRPHFEAVRHTMAGLMQAAAAQGQDLTLPDAYEQAIYAVPTIRARIQEDQRKADEEKRRAEAVKKAADAKKASQVNVRSSTAGAAPKSWEDDLTEIARRAYG